MEPGPGQDTLLATLQERGDPDSQTLAKVPKPAWLGWSTTAQGAFSTCRASADHQGEPEPHTSLLISGRRKEQVVSAPVATGLPNTE